MSCSLYIAGDVYMCENKRLKGPVFIGNSKEEAIDVKKGQKPCIQTFMWIMANLYFFNNKLERISLELLRAIAACLASKSNTVPSVFFIDQTLQFTKNQPKNRPNTAKGRCSSIYHTGAEPATDLRLPRRCPKCASLELQIEISAWPTISSLQKRLRPELMSMIRAGFPLDTRRHILGKLVGPLAHDLQLAKLNITAKTLALTTPLFKTILKISRSVHRKKICDSLDTLITHGFAVIDELPKNTKSCFKPYLLRSFNVIFLPSLVNVIHFLGTKKPTIGLAAPDNQLNQNGLSFEKIVTSQPKVIYGARSWGRCETFETLLSFAKALGCTLAPIDHAFFSKTTDPAKRKALHEEETNPYQHLKDISAVVDALIHANIMEREPESGRLLVASGGVQKSTRPSSKRTDSAAGSGENSKKEQTQRQKKRRKTQDEDREAITGEYQIQTDVGEASNSLPKSIASL